MKYLLVPEDLPSGDPDFRRNLERYPKSINHHARLVPVGDDFAQKCRNIPVIMAFRHHENWPDLEEIELESI